MSTTCMKIRQLQHPPSHKRTQSHKAVCRHVRQSIGQRQSDCSPVGRGEVGEHGSTPWLEGLWSSWLVALNTQLPVELDLHRFGNPFGTQLGPPTCRDVPDEKRSSRFNMLLDQPQNLHASGFVPLVKVPPWSGPTREDD